MRNVEWTMPAALQIHSHNADIHKSTLLLLAADKDFNNTKPWANTALVPPRPKVTVFHQGSPCLPSLVEQLASHQPLLRCHACS